ncbi:52 kDa repressor of the inhibitor of the protein kinase-like [Myzus persicae]|uniref:52 kDa repressor of the inhibitor of the protein kinase-like n=1 Tax=Myzus persicae TaxID=13164 RepID=UPI000B9324A3|nr:52 kDa repressor of the inhibitor of the protein kinase-like [Myzus persicae]
MWKLKLASSNNEITKTRIEAFLNCDKEIYPNIKLLLKIFVTLPVSTATPERRFSSLKRLKTHLRNTMNETRLNGLSLLSIHRDIVDIDLSVEEVVDELSKKKS